MLLKLVLSLVFMYAESGYDTHGGGVRVHISNIILGQSKAKIRVFLYLLIFIINGFFSEFKCVASVPHCAVTLGGVNQMKYSMMDDSCSHWCLCVYIDFLLSLGFVAFEAYRIPSVGWNYNHDDAHQRLSSRLRIVLITFLMLQVCADLSRYKATSVMRKILSSL